MAKLVRERGIDRAVDILDCLLTHGQPMVINELAAAMGAPRSTIYQMSKVLLDRSILDFYSGGRVFLGRKLYLYGSSVTQQYSLIEISKPFINKLAEKLGEVVELNWLVDWKQGILYAAEGRRSYFFYSLKSGQGYPSYPLPLTSSGRFLIYGKDKATIEKHIPAKDYFRDGKRLITVERLMQESKQAMIDGYIITSNLLDTHISAISCPIINSEGVVMATIGLAFPTGEMNKNKNKNLFIKELKKTTTLVQEKFLQE